MQIPCWWPSAACEARPRSFADPGVRRRACGSEARKCAPQASRATYRPSPAQLVAVALEALAAEQVRQRPVRPARSAHGSRTRACGRRVGEVDDDEVACRRPSPGPGDELRRTRRLSGQPRALAQPPVAVAQPGSATAAQQPRVERRAGRRRAARPGAAAEEHRDADPPALDWPSCSSGAPGSVRRDDRGRARAGRRRERRRRARLVVVLDEAHRAAPGSRGRRARWPRTGAGVLVHEPVVEPLVVAEVEALLLQRPLHVPVRLGDEHEVGVRGAARAPITVGQNSVAPAAAPARSPHVRAKTSLIISIAMSQRTPSHCSAIVDQRRRPPPRAAPAANALSCTTSGHGGKYGSRPRARTAPPTARNARRVARRGRPPCPRTNQLRVLGRPTGGRARRGWARSRGSARRPRAASAARAAASAAGPPKRSSTT